MEEMDAMPLFYAIHLGGPEIAQPHFARDGYNNIGLFDSPPKGAFLQGGFHDNFEYGFQVCESEGFGEEMHGQSGVGDFIAQSLQGVLNDGAVIKGQFP